MPSRSKIDETDLRNLVQSGVLEDPDIVRVFFGKLLGEGVSRRVYRCHWDDTMVLKLAIGNRPDFQNQAEWDLWNGTTTAMGKWLAPVHYISPRGHLLIQAYCEPCPTHLIPVKVPALIADSHDANWGIYEGRPVLHDYGRHYAFKMASNAQSMKRLVSRDGTGSSEE